MFATTLLLGAVGVILLVCGILTLRAMDDLDNGNVAQAKRKMAFLKNSALAAMAILVLAMGMYILVERNKPESASHHPAIHAMTVLGLLLGIVLTGALAYNENTAMCYVLRSNLSEAKSQMVPQMLLSLVGAMMVLGSLLLGWFLHHRRTTSSLGGAPNPGVPPHPALSIPAHVARNTGISIVPFSPGASSPLDATTPYATGQSHGRARSALF